jgi:hypothetical protein
VSSWFEEDVDRASADKGRGEMEWGCANFIVRFDGLLSTAS